MASAGAAAVRFKMHPDEPYDHLLVSDDDAEICIGEPFCEFLATQDRELVREFNKRYVWLAMVVGAATLVAPMVMAELRLSAQRKGNEHLRPQAPGQPAQTAPGSPHGGGIDTRRPPGYLANGYVPPGDARFTGPGDDALRD
jgi:hypothetical protein